MPEGKQFPRAPGSLSSHFHPDQSVLPESRIVTHTWTFRILTRSLLPVSSSKPMSQSHTRKLELVAFFRQQRHESLDSARLSSNTCPPQGKMRQTAEQPMRQRHASNVRTIAPPLAETSHFHKAQDVPRFHFHPFNPDEMEDIQKDARANLVTKEGQLAKAFSAFLDVPLALESESVAQEMRACHPRPCAEDVRQFPRWRHVASPCGEDNFHCVR